MSGPTYHWNCKDCGRGMTSKTSPHRWRLFCPSCDPYSAEARRAYALGWFAGRYPPKFTVS
jgi:Zn finger protein HypA/HybF involved in hydrogenase expression